jgi:hypothetical protein
LAGPLPFICRRRASRRFFWKGIVLFLGHQALRQECLERKQRCRELVEEYRRTVTFQQNSGEQAEWLTLSQALER